MSLPSRRFRGPIVVALALLAVLAVACGGGADGPGDGPPGPAANATQSTLLRPSADSPAAVPTRTATLTPATATLVAPVITRTPVPGCARGATAPPAIYYGYGLAEGEVVAAFNTRPGCEQIVCEQTEVDGDGLWVLRVAGDNVCGVRDGDRVIFTIDGEPSGVSAVWSAGDAPADAQRGITLRDE